MNNKIKLLKSLADNTRLTIVAKILSKREVSCAQLQSMFELSQPTFSHHIGKLIDANIVTMRKEGTSHFYSINTVYIQKMGINLAKMVEV